VLRGSRGEAAGTELGSYFVERVNGCKVAYLAGLAMRRIADLYPGEAKTDARDAFIIADATRSMPHTLRSIDLCRLLGEGHSPG
jgi:hypothetical protein